MKKFGIKLQNIDICDVGCATGEFTENIYGNNKCYGLDISEYAIKQCQKKFPNSKKRFIQLDLNKEKFNTKYTFDLITLFDVIEHLDNFIYLDLFLKNNVKKNGYVVITTPNANSLTRPLQRAYFTGEMDATHRLLFTPYTLDFFLRRRGLKKIALFTPYYFYMGYNLLSKFLRFGGQIFAIYKKQ